MRDTLAGRGQINYDDLSDAEVADLKALVSNFLEGSASVDLLPCQALKQVKETYRQMQSAYTASKSSQVILLLYVTMCMCISMCMWVVIMTLVLSVCLAKSCGKALTTCLASHLPHDYNMPHRCRATH